MKNFRTYDLALQFYRACTTIAEDKTQGPIWKDQFKRASLSILLNIAEGSGKADQLGAHLYKLIQNPGSLR